MDHHCGERFCNGIKYQEFDGRTYCEYEEFRRSVLDAWHDDGMPLWSADSNEHYRRTTAWYTRIWHRIKALFVRPKLSSENLEEMTITL